MLKQGCSRHCPTPVRQPKPPVLGPCRWRHPQQLATEIRLQLELAVGPNPASPTGNAPPAPLPPSRRFFRESGFHPRAAFSESTPRLEPTSVELYHACSAKGVRRVILVPPFGHPGGLSRPASSASGGIRNAFPAHARPSSSRSGFRSPFAFPHLSTEGSSPVGDLLAPKAPPLAEGVGGFAAHLGRGINHPKMENPLYPLAGSETPPEWRLKRGAMKSEDVWFLGKDLHHRLDRTEDHVAPAPGLSYSATKNWEIGKRVLLSCRVEPLVELKAELASPGAKPPRKTSPR